MPVRPGLGWSGVRYLLSGTSRSRDGQRRRG